MKILLAFFYIYFMKSFSNIQNATPTFTIICEGRTLSEYSVKFEFAIKALNETAANEQADAVIKELNLKDSSKTVKRA